MTRKQRIMSGLQSGACMAGIYLAASVAGLPWLWRQNHAAPIPFELLMALTLGLTLVLLGMATHLAVETQPMAVPLFLDRCIIASVCAALAIGAVWLDRGLTVPIIMGGQFGLMAGWYLIAPLLAEHRLNRLEDQLMMDDLL